MLAGAVSFSDRDHGALAQRLARGATFPGQRSRPLAAGSGLWLHAVGAADADEGPVTHEAGELASFLFADACRVPAWRKRIDPSTLANGASLDVPQRWLGLRWDRALRRLSITTDRLGLLWLYWARIPAGLAFSSDFGSLARELAGGLTVERDTALLELAYGYTPDDRTVFNQIRIVPPGTTLELDASGITAVGRRSPSYTDRSASLTQAEKFDRLDALYAPIANRTAENGAALTMSLSAGFDSRYALAFLQSRRPRIACCTFGNPDSDEVRGAARVAATAGMATEVFDIPDGDWAQWTRDIQALGNAGMTQWSGWAESWLAFVRERGSLPVIGFLGDALTGKHLGENADTADWIGFWQWWSTRDGWATCDLLSAEARERIARVGRERLEATVATLAFAFPHQAAMHLDLYGRQRRWVASQPNLGARFGTPMQFFYDEALIDFWTSVPFDDLLAQRLYLAYASDRFPSLFAAPRAKRPWPGRRIVAKALRVAMGRDRERPIVVDLRRSIAPNRARIVALARRTRPLLHDVLDIDRFCAQVEQFGRGPTIPGTLMARAVNLMLLLDLCVDGRDSDATAQR